MSPTRQYFILAILSGIFLFMSLQKLELPGYGYDEGLNSVVALNLLQGEEPEIGTFINFFGNRPMLMLSNYEGSAQTYMLMPFLILFGENYMATRIMPIFIAMLCIWLTWLLGELLFNKRTALLAALFLATNASYLLWSRIGISNYAPVLLLFSLASILFLFKWCFYKKTYYLWIASFVAGVGLYAKINFLFVIIAIVVCLFLLYHEDIRTLKFYELFIACSLFLLGALPFVYYNIYSGGETFQLFFHSLLRPTWAGVSNLDIYNNFIVRARQFVSTVGWSHYDIRGKVAGNLLTPVFVLSSYCFLGITVFTDKKYFDKKEIKSLKAILLIQAVIFLVSIFTVSNFSVTQLLILLPFTVITMAVFCDYMFGAEIKYCSLIAVILIFIVTLTNIRVIYKEYSRLAKIGGDGMWFDTVYALTDYLSDSNIKTPIVMDWGLKYNIEVISGGEIRPIEGLEFQKAERKSDKFIEKYHKYFNSPENHYIFISEPYGMHGKKLGYHDIFNYVLEKREIECRKIKEFINKKGKPVYKVCTVK